MPEALLKINAEFAVVSAANGNIETARIQIRLMRESHLGRGSIEKVAGLVLAPTRNRIGELIQRTRQSALENPSAAHETVRNLLEQAQLQRDLFDLFDGEQAHAQKDLFDEIATTATDCLVACQCQTGDHETFVELLEQALGIAESVEVRERIEENIGIGQEHLRESAVDAAYSVIQSVQDGMENPSMRLAWFKREAIAAMVNAVGASGDLEVSGSPATFSPDQEDLFDAAALVLRGLSLEAWNNHQDRKTAIEANELAAKYAPGWELKCWLAEDRRNFDELPCSEKIMPVIPAPRLNPILGTGFALYGESDPNPSTGSYLSTYYFVFVGIPIIPICRYRVARKGSSYRFYGKAKLRARDGFHLAVSLLVIVSLVILFSDARKPTPSAAAPSPSQSSGPQPSAQAPPAPTASAPAPPSVPDGGDSGGDVYVPSGVAPALELENAGIEADRAVLKHMDAQVEALAREIELDRSRLDNSSQAAVAAFNAKVNRYNVLFQQAKTATDALNKRVDEYNSKLELDRVR